MYVRSTFCNEILHLQHLRFRVLHYLVYAIPSSNVEDDALVYTGVIYRLFFFFVFVKFTLSKSLSKS